MDGKGLQRNVNDPKYVFARQKSFHAGKHEEKTEILKRGLDNDMGLTESFGG
jgi:hypothetical protein